MPVSAGAAGTADDSAAWPCVRLFPLNNCLTRSLPAMPWGPAGTDKTASGQALLDTAMRDFPHAFTKGQVWLLDRLWHGTARLKALAQLTRFAVRLKSGIPLRKISEICPGHTYLAEISGDGVTMTVRVTGYFADVEGQQAEEMSCLVTSLLDWREYPGPELAASSSPRSAPGTPTTRRYCNQPDRRIPDRQAATGHPGRPVEPARHRRGTTATAMPSNPELQNVSEKRTAHQGPNPESPWHCAVARTPRA